MKKVWLLRGVFEKIVYLQKDDTLLKAITQYLNDEKLPEELKLALSFREAMLYHGG